MSSRYDVVVVGAGHNGLVAAAYLARAGLSVLVLERLNEVGGAAVSATPLAGVVRVLRRRGRARAAARGGRAPGLA